MVSWKIFFKRQAVCLSYDMDGSKSQNLNSRFAYFNFETFILLLRETPSLHGVYFGINTYISQQCTVAFFNPLLLNFHWDHQTRKINKIILYTNSHGDNFRNINGWGLPFSIIHLQFLFENRELFARYSISNVIN